MLNKHQSSFSNHRCLIKDFSFENLIEIQLEISTYCNAACPQCTRNDCGGATNPYFQEKFLSPDVIKRVVSENYPAGLKQIFFCGGYGEPIVHPQFLEICEFIRQHKPQTYIYTHTNGSVHDPEWWTRLAKIVPKDYGRVAFGIDGLEDTHSIHRKGTSFSKILKNAKAYIDAGGEAQWSYLVFKHNQHQVEEARNLAKDLGFSSFQKRSTGRFFDQRRFEPMKSWPVKDKNGNKEYEILPTDDPKYLNESIQNFEKIKESHENFFDYLDKVEVCCDALKGSKIIINHEGLVLPCGQLNENLYDGRFFEEKYEPKVYLDEATGKPAQQFINMLDSYGRERLSILERSLESVLQEKFYKDIMDSWNKKSIEEGKLFECSFSCGKKFTKWLDQNLEKSDLNP